MKYRLTHDGGHAIDVPGVLWESVLERAFWNGWRPSGTEAPWAAVRRMGTGPGAGTGKVQARGDTPLGKGGRWPHSDYFSACLQYVRAADAFELGTAAMAARRARADGTPHPDCKHDTGIRKVAHFARSGGFVIGRAPDHESAS